MLFPIIIPMIKMDSPGPVFLDVRQDNVDFCKAMNESRIIATQGDK
jgi:hypothetical protein